MAAVETPTGSAKAPGRVWPIFCDDPHHDPPSLILPPEGGMTHECPTCGKRTTVYPPHRAC